MTLEQARARTFAALEHAQQVSRDYVYDRATKRQKAIAWSAHKRAATDEYLERVRELARLARVALPSLTGATQRELRAVLELFPKSHEPEPDSKETPDHADSQ